jgi:serine/threonine-protein kinase
VKPDNILLGVDGIPKVVDFGMARSLTSSAQITQPGHILGTPLYMSPEQCEGHAIDGRSDLYSLGATLYHALSGRPPFTGETVLSILKKHCEVEAQPLHWVTPHVSREVAAVVDRLLSKRPEHRFASWHEALSALPESTAWVPAP